jgi:hypothetical protein
MNESQVRAIFLLAGIEIHGLEKIPNKYWPEAYVEARQESPWWKVKTERGIIQIGWRKRVISIEWCNLGIVYPMSSTPQGKEYSQHKHVSTDDVTKWPTGIHAWSLGKAVDYLVSLRRGFEVYDYVEKCWAEAEIKPEDLHEFVVCFYDENSQAVYAAVKAPNERRAMTQVCKLEGGCKVDRVMLKTEHEAMCKQYTIPIVYKEYTKE